MTSTIARPRPQMADLIGGPVVGRDGKSVLMGGSRELQLRFECFNLLNRANFGTPQQNVFNTNGTIREDAGRITTTSTSSRQIQLGVKFVW